jgi:hypothetical protein
VSPEAVVKTLEEMLGMGASVNIYLMHGGLYILEAGKKYILYNKCRSKNIMLTEC